MGRRGVRSCYWESRRLGLGLLKRDDFVIRAVDNQGRNRHFGAERVADYRSQVESIGLLVACVSRQVEQYPR